MKLTPEQIRGLVQLIGITRDEELSCNECLDRIAEFAECQLTGQPIPAALATVEHHLNLCAECREEYEALRQALSGL